LGIIPAFPVKGKGLPVQAASSADIRPVDDFYRMSGQTASGLFFPENRELS